MVVKDNCTDKTEIRANWLITGGCGFVGTALIKSLIKDKAVFSIRVLDNLKGGNRDDLGSVCDFKEVRLSSLADQSIGDNARQCKVELVVGDIRDVIATENVCKGIDTIVHLAASTSIRPSLEDPRFDMESNVIGTLNMLEGARKNGVKRFIFASSGAPAGEVEPPIHEELAPKPVSPYGASKLAGEGYCSAYFGSFGIETVALRFGNVYGPGSSHKSSVVAKFIKKAMAGEKLEIYGDGNQTRDFVYIGDLVRAIRAGATVEGIGGETFQIATNSETTILKLVEKLVPVLSDHGIFDVDVFHGEMKKGDVRRNYSDTSKAKRMLGWQSEVSLATGLKSTVDWFF